MKINNRCGPFKTLKVIRKSSEKSTSASEFFAQVFRDTLDSLILISEVTRGIHSLIYKIIHIKSNVGDMM